MRYHVLMPFHRIKNKNIIIKHLRQFNVVLHPIINESIEFPKENWIKPFVFGSPPPEVRWVYYYALNKFIGRAEIIDDDYYMFKMMSNSEGIGTTPVWAALPDKYQRASLTPKIIEGKGISHEEAKKRLKKWLK